MHKEPNAAPGDTPRPPRRIEGFLLTSSEVEELAGLWRLGLRRDALRRAHRITRASFYELWKAFDQHVAGSEIAEHRVPPEWRKASDDPQIAEDAAQEWSRVKRRTVTAGFAILALFVAAAFVPLQTWLLWVLPGGLLAIVSPFMWRARDGTSGAILIMLGALLLVVSGVVVIGLRGASPDGDVWKFGLGIHLLATFFMGLSPALLASHGQWRRGDAQLELDRPALAPEIVAWRRARPVARLCMLISFALPVLAIHSVVVAGPWSEATFNAIFRFLLFAPILGAAVGWMTAPAGYSLRKCVELLAVPALLAAVAVWGRSVSMHELLAEVGLLYVVATVVGVPVHFVLSRRYYVEEFGLRRAGLLFLAVLGVLVLLSFGVGGLLLDVLYGGELGWAGWRSWLPLLITALWVGVEIAPRTKAQLGVPERGATAEGEG